MITLPPLKDALPIIRKAFDNKELQMFNEGGSKLPKYSGPCAIGVLLSPEDREFLDKFHPDEAITGIEDIIIECSQEAKVFRTLQHYHDVVVTTPNDKVTKAFIELFETKLTSLEEQCL